MGTHPSLKEARAALDLGTVNLYSDLTTRDAKRLLVEDKWFASLRQLVEGEIDQVSQNLTGRTRLIGERYARSLSAIAAEADTFAAKVDRHLQEMGFSL